jgi:hypothetical protein
LGRSLVQKANDPIDIGFGARDQEEFVGHWAGRLYLTRSSSMTTSTGR